MELITQRLKMIPCTREYISSISKEQYQMGGHITSHVTKLEQDSSLYGWGVWLVIEKESGKIVGDIGFKGKPDAEGTVEIGYGIVPAAQKKGYATESVEQIIDWAFQTNLVQRVIAECLVDNIASIKVLENMKMRKTGQDGEMLKWEMKRADGVSCKKNSIPH